MFKHKRFRFIPFILLIMLSFTYAAPTFACFYADPPLEQVIDGSRYVFVGTIVATFVNENNSLTAQIEVERYLQGEGLAVVYLTDFYPYPPNPRYGGCDTDIEIAEGQRWVFFGNGDGQTLQTYRTDKNYNKVYLAFDDLPDRVVSAYINNPFRPVYRLEWQLEQSRYAAPFYYYSHEIAYRLQFLKPTAIAMFSLGLVDVLVVIFVVRRWRTYNRPISSKRGNSDKG